MQVGHDSLIHNLKTLEKDIEAGGVIEPSHFRIVHDRNGSEVLKTNGFFRRIFGFHYHSAAHAAQLAKLVKSQITELTHLSREELSKDSSLSTAIYRYDQAVATSRSLKRPKDEAANDITEDGKVKLQRPDLKQAKELQGVTPTKVKIKDPTIALRHDAPKITHEKRFGFTFPIKRYRTDHDHAGHDHDHFSEAKRIGSSTQKERVLNLIGRMLRAVGFQAKSFEKYRYGAGIDKQAIYSSDEPLKIAVNPKPIGDQLPSPTSYWLGHATLMLGVPLRSETNQNMATTIRVITDPVEGDLAPLLYPRMTKFAKPMEEIPPPQVYLLSHNHLDHYSATTIKKLLTQQPVMVVPQGDGWRYRDAGFKNVHEIDWWQSAKIKFEQDGEKYTLNVRGIPARHWAGQGPCGGHSSTFLGYMVEDIYFAGDTAPLDYKRKESKDSILLKEYLQDEPNVLKEKIAKSENRIASHVLKIKEEILSNQSKIEEIQRQRDEALQMPVDPTNTVIKNMEKEIEDIEAQIEDLQFKLKHDEIRTHYASMPLEQLRIATKMAEEIGNPKSAKIAAHVLELRELEDLHRQKADKVMAKINQETNPRRRAVLMEKLNFHLAEMQEAAHFAMEGEGQELSHIDAIRKFKPKYYFAPGGPDDVRADMETTHQCSAYGLQAHVEILLQGLDYKNMTKTQFLEEAKSRKTVYMHTMTYKLGNLKLMDTPDSVERMLLALEKITPGLRKIIERNIQGNRSEDLERIIRNATSEIKPEKATMDQEWRIGMRPYEWQVYMELVRLADEMKFADGSTLSTKELAQLLHDTVIVPKIGSNIDLGVPKAAQQDKIVV